MLLTSTLIALSFALSAAATTGFELESRATKNITEYELPVLSKCSQSCLAEGMPSSGCEPTDTACLCTSQNFTAAVGACLVSKCTVIDALTSQQYSAISCKAPVRDNSGITRGISWFTFTLATLCVVARFISRLPALKGSGYSWDDYIIFASWFLLFPTDIILTHMTYIGLGMDIWMVPDFANNITEILKLFYASEHLYVIEMNTTKISILFLYLRMWPTTDARWFRPTCYILIGLLSALSIFLVMILGLQCQPISYSWTKWNPALGAGYCINVNALIYATAGLNIFFDIIVIALPIPRLLALSIPMRKKVAVCVTFSIGLFVTFCSIIRVHSLASWGTAPNVTWYYNSIAIWSNVELNLGVVCACVPALAGLIQRIYVRITGHEFSVTGGPSRTRSRFDNRAEKHELPAGDQHGNVDYYGHQGHGLQEHPVELKQNPHVRNESWDETRPNVSSHGPLDRSMAPTPERDATQQMIDAGYSAFSQFPGSKTTTREGPSRFDDDA